MYLKTESRLFMLKNTCETCKVSTFTRIKEKEMIEGKRQKQVASVLEKELNEIFQRLGLGMINGTLVSIAAVKITPDLYEARVYLSCFKGGNPGDILKKVEERSWEIKKELTTRVRHQLRSMPILKFFIDDTLEYVDKMEQLFKDIKKQDEDIQHNSHSE